MGREDFERRCSEFDESLRLHQHPYNSNIDDENEEAADREVVEQKETSEMQSNFKDDCEAGNEGEQSLYSGTAGPVTVAAANEGSLENYQSSQPLHPLRV